jgi:hypothetical protein
MTVSILQGEIRGYKWIVGLELMDISSVNYKADKQSLGIIKNGYRVR